MIEDWASSTGGLLGHRGKDANESIKVLYAKYTGKRQQLSRFQPNKQEADGGHAKKSIKI